MSSRGIGLAQLILAAALFALADATRAGEIVRPWRVDAALLRHPRQHLAISLASVEAHDRALRRN
ncbi:MAG: hypothetical protein M3178_15400 [Pseudomonadota bacterium]|nr:hypothetical protein [Pseudomonadota bacterium]